MSSKTFFCPLEPVSDTHAHWLDPGSEGERVQAEDLPPRWGQPGTFCSIVFPSDHIQTAIFVISNYFNFVFFMFQSPLTVTLPSPEPLTAAMFLFLLNMKEPGKGPLNPKLLFNQLCQKYDAFFILFSIKSSMTTAWTGCLFCWHVVPLLCWWCTSPSPAFSLSCFCDRSHQPDTGSIWSQLNESSTYMKHSQREWTTFNGLSFFLCCLLLLCHLCHIWSRSGFNRLNHCCVCFFCKNVWLAGFFLVQRCLGPPCACQSGASCPV